MSTMNRRLRWLIIVLIFGLLIAISCDEEKNPIHTTDNVLIIGLTTGFNNDLIRIQVNADTAFEDSVSTNMSIDFAIELVPATRYGVNSLRITHLQSNITDELLLDVVRNVYLDISLIRSTTGALTGFKFGVFDQPPWQGND